MATETDTDQPCNVKFRMGRVVEGAAVQNQIGDVIRFVVLRLRF